MLYDIIYSGLNVLCVWVLSGLSISNGYLDPQGISKSTNINTNLSVSVSTSTSPSVNISMRIN